jgi:uncharacterized protein YegP (UPF0339 family)
MHVTIHGVFFSIFAPNNPTVFFETEMNQSETAAERLAALVKANSKHSDYQLLHPMIRYAVGDTYQPAGKQEERRQAYMQSSLPLSGKVF